MPIMLWTIVGPAIAAIEGVELLDVCLDKFPIPVRPVLLESEVGKNAEP